MKTSLNKAAAPKRRIKNDKPVYAIEKWKGCYALVNVDRVLIMVDRDLKSLAYFACTVSNMAWQFDLTELSDLEEMTFVNVYNDACEKEYESYLKRINKL